MHQHNLNASISEDQFHTWIRMHKTLPPPKNFTVDNEFWERLVFLYDRVINQLLAPYGKATQYLPNQTFIFRVGIEPLEPTRVLFSTPENTSHLVDFVPLRGRLGAVFWNFTAESSSEEQIQGKAVISVVHTGLFANEGYPITFNCDIKVSTSLSSPLTFNSRFRLPDHRWTAMMKSLQVLSERGECPVPIDCAEVYGTKNAGAKLKRKSYMVDWPSIFFDAQVIRDGWRIVELNKGSHSADEKRTSKQHSIECTLRNGSRASVEYHSKGYPKFSVLFHNAKALVEIPAEVTKMKADLLDDAESLAKLLSFAGSFIGKPIGQPTGQGKSKCDRSNTASFESQSWKRLVLDTSRGPFLLWNVGIEKLEAPAMETSDDFGGTQSEESSANDDSAKLIGSIHDQSRMRVRAWTF